MQDPQRPASDGVNPYVPEVLAEAEQKLRRVRRGLSSDDGLPPAVGVALSGGGIRSATFCLGVFQAIARLRLLKSVDYLSTVSGGGYFGACLGRLFTRPFIGIVKNAEDELTSVGLPTPAQPHGTGLVAWLRENGRYLSPGGTADVMQMLTVILRNWVAVHITLASVLLPAAFALVLLRGAVEALVPAMPADGLAWLARSVLVSAEYGLWVSPFWVLAAAAGLVAAVPTGWAYWLLEWPSNERIRARARRSLGWIVGALGGGLLCSGLAAWVAWSRADRWQMAIIGYAAGVVLVVAGLRIHGVIESRRADASRRPSLPRQVPSAIAVASVIAVLVWVGLAGHRQLAYGGGVVVVMLLLFWLWSRSFFVRQADRAQDYLDALARNRLTTWLRRTLVTMAAILAVTLADSIGESVYRAASADRGLAEVGPLAALLAVLSALSAPAAKIFPLIVGQPGKVKWASLWVPVLTAAALVILSAFLSAAFLLAHAVRWSFGWVGPFGMHTLAWPGLALALSLLFAVLFGATWSFLNNSAQLPFYRARLTRAYLGSSNPDRITPRAAATAGGGGTNVTHVVPGDDIGLLEYFGVGDCASSENGEEPPLPTNAFAHGAPLHLINVTVNCTRGSASQIQRQDRKGLILSLGPCGMSAGVADHVVFQRDAGSTALPSRELCKASLEGGAALVPVVHPTGTAARTSRFQVVPEDKASWLLMEPLTLGHWTAVSGAAFTTGTGYRTNLGLSLMAGFGNVRLGYWWDSHHQTESPGFWFWHVVRRLFAVQTYLAHEFLARFPGTSQRHWYLSDGGHFENLGGYELIRRRLPTIVLIDAEADPEFEFGGLANLVRSVRTDFGADVRFLDDAALDAAKLGDARSLVGTLDDIAGRRAPVAQAATEAAGADGPVLSRAHAALAEITYRGSAHTKSLLLYVKASMSGDERVDLRTYHRTHPRFPHEPTSDQYFDEAQWESYRALGEHIGETLFGTPSVPWALR